MLLFIFIQLIEYAGSPDKLGIGGDWACCYNICKIRNKLTKRLNVFHFSLKTKLFFFTEFCNFRRNILKKYAWKGLVWKERLEENLVLGYPQRMRM